MTVVRFKQAVGLGLCFEPQHGSPAAFEVEQPVPREVLLKFRLWQKCWKGRPLKSMTFAVQHTLSQSVR